MKMWINHLIRKLIIEYILALKYCTCSVMVTGVGYNWTMPRAKRRVKLTCLKMGSFFERSNLIVGAQKKGSKTWIEMVLTFKFFQQCQSCSVIGYVKSNVYWMKILTIYWIKILSSIVKLRLLKQFPFILG